jgi:V/A-type H+-transporting ATPase subunit I
MAILRPERMQKVGILGLKEDREAVLTALHDLKVAQIEPVSAETLRYLEAERASETQRAVGDEALRLRGLKNALPSRPEKNPVRFQNLAEVLATAKTVPIDAEVGHLVREEDRLQSEARSLSETRSLLDRLSFLSGRLDDLQTDHFLPFLAEGLDGVADRLSEIFSQDEGAQVVRAPVGDRAIVLVPRDHPDLVGRVAPTSGIRLTAIPPLKGTVLEARGGIEARATAVETRRQEIRSRLGELSEEWYPTVAALDEALSIQNRLFEVYTKLGSGKATFAVEGWVPQRELSRLRAAIETASQGRAYYYTVPTQEEPPTLMRNPAGVSRYEFFIRFYSLPQSTEWDPTLVFAIVFPIFFGFMLGDWGYGLVILAICLWMIAGFPGGSRLPKALRSFVTRIMGPQGMRQLAYALVPGCLIAIGVGLYFDEFFGFAVLNALFGYTPAIRPAVNVGLLLLLAGYIGVAMVTLGFAMGALKEYFHHHYAGAVGKVGGIVFTWAIALVGLYVIHTGTFAGPLFFTYVGVAIVGILLMLIGEKFYALMGLIEVVSHILSYTRLVGILLASVILAGVINYIGTHLQHHFTGDLFIVGIVIAVFIIVLGQAFNVILGVFEPGIQGARLLFVEYFSKFYTGNGRPFRPFGAERTHTLPPVPPTAVGTSPVSGPIVRGPQSVP